MMAAMKPENSQPGILAALTAVARSVTFRIVPDSDLRRTVAALRDGFEIDRGVAGIGAPLARAVGAEIPGLQRDAVIGRRLDTNEEIADAPVSAHVKRAAQESFDPPAFILRRSMPWAEAHEHGLEFIAFGESPDRFERVLRRMVGLDDGTSDALFSFSRPVRGGYYWCPPIANGRLDLSKLGI